MNELTMTRTRLRGLAAVTAVAVTFTLFGPARATCEDLPTGAEVLDRFVEVTGGADAYEGLRTSRTTGTLELAGQGVTFEMVRYGARPNKAAVILTSEAFGEIRRGTDGVAAWETSVMSGPRLMEGDELAELLRDATFDSVAGWRGLWESADTTGVETVNDRPCYRVELHPRTGGPQTVWFDVDTGLLVKVEREVRSVMGNVPVVSYSSDWREAGGVLISHRAEVVAAGQTRVVTVDSVDYNVDLPGDCFVPPPDVQKLLSKEEPKS